jgi:hypothetical protein
MSHISTARRRTHKELEMKAKVGLNVLIGLVMLAAMLPFAAPVQAAPPVDEIPADAEFVPGEVIVMFDTDVPAEQTTRAAALAGEVGGQVVATSQFGALLSFAEDADVLGLVADISTRRGVKAAEPNYIFSVPEKEPQLGSLVEQDTITSVDRDGAPVERKIEDLRAMRTVKVVDGKATSIPTYPTDPNWPWGWYEIGSHLIWPDAKTSPIVCVLDTGVDYKHPDLYGKIINGKDYVNNDSVPNDDNGHGTHVAGIIAAKGNNKLGVIGVSNGKVLAVKVLNSVGIGTDWNIAMGLVYCANYTGVKVINMSLGGPAAIFQLLGLDYAINTKGRLVVAAAGNGSTSNRTYAYPAAYADSVDGLISVAAAYPAWEETQVDSDSDNVHDSWEVYDSCAASFTNYGSWVELAAPGYDVYSTTPVSYAFYMNWYYGIYSGYDSLNGTSQAAPYVAGAAARAWSIYPTMTKADIEDLLKSTGDNLDERGSFVVDPGVTVSYVDDGYNIPAAEYSGGNAPYCWPHQFGNYGADQNMHNTRYVDVAEAMNRGALTVVVQDGTNGLPLEGAYVKAVSFSTGSTRGTVKIGRYDYYGTDILDLPAYETEKLMVSKSGYTYGYQTFAYEYADPGLYYGYDASHMYVGVPTTQGISVVVNWTWPDYILDLGLFVFQPEFIDPTNHNEAIVGFEKYGWEPNAQMGTLVGAPYMAFRHEGSYYDAIPMESITIGKKPGYNYPYYPGDYWVMLQDSYYTSGKALNDADPLVRIWNGGVLKATWYGMLSNTCSIGTQDAWLAGRIYKSGTTTAYEEKTPFFCRWDQAAWPYIP